MQGCQMLMSLRIQRTGGSARAFDIKSRQLMGTVFVVHVRCIVIRTTGSVPILYIDWGVTSSSSPGMTPGFAAMVDDYLACVLLPNG